MKFKAYSNQTSFRNQKISKMKGTEDIIWMLGFAFIIIVVSLVLINFFSAPVSGLIDEATKLDAKYWSYQISGVISLSQTSDNGISTKIFLPRQSGQILIYSNKVEVAFGEKNRYDHHITEYDSEKEIKLIDYVKDPANPQPSEKIDIDVTKNKAIIVQKINNTIVIKSEVR